MATIHRSIGSGSEPACVRAVEEENAPNYTVRLDTIPTQSVVAGDRFTDSALNQYTLLALRDANLVDVQDEAGNGVAPALGDGTLSRYYTTFAAAHAGIATDVAAADDLVWNVLPDSVFDENIVISDTTLTTGSLTLIAAGNAWPEIGMSRHKGVEGAGVVIQPTTAGPSLRITSAVTYEITIDGLEFVGWKDAVGTREVAILDEAASGTLILDRLILRNNGNAASADEVVAIEASPTVGRIVTIRNTLIRNVHNNAAANKAIGIRLQVAGQEIHNCTIRDVKNLGAGANGSGVEVLAAVVAPGVEIRGVVATECDLDFSILGGAGDISAASDRNASADATAPGTNPATSVVPAAAFVSALDSRVPPNSVLIDVANNITAEFTTDIADKARSGAEPWDIGAYDGGLTDPVEIIAETEENVAELLADLPEFRAWVGASTRAQARVRIYFDEVEPPAGETYTLAEWTALRPYALIRTEGLSIDKRGAPNTFVSNGSVTLVLVENVTDNAQLARLDPQDVGRRFKNHIGKILRDIKDLSHVAGHLQVERVNYPGVVRAHPDDVAVQGEFVMCELEVQFGPGSTV